MRFVDDPKASQHVKAFLAAAETGAGLPPLYATLKRDFSGRSKDGAVKSVLKGQRVRVVDVGKFGDLGVTTDIDDPKRADVRATLAEMSEYSDKP